MPARSSFSDQRLFCYKKVRAFTRYPKTTSIYSIHSHLEYRPAENVLEPISVTPEALRNDVVEQVRTTESLIHRWSHHLNLWVQDYFGSGTLGGFHSLRLSRSLWASPITSRSLSLINA